MSGNLVQIGLDLLDHVVIEPGLARAAGGCGGGNGASRKNGEEDAGAGHHGDSTSLEER